MDTNQLADVASLFQVLADPTRLRILGAIADQPLTGRELADRLGLSAATISHHMHRLEQRGLVVAHKDGTRCRYRLDERTLRDASRAATAATTGSPPPAADGRPETTKVLRDFFVDGRLKQIPAQRKKRVVVLQHLLERFQPDRDYPEREVNDLLRPAHDDVATLRRELVDYGFMTRHAGLYRVAASLPPRGPTVRQEIPGDEHAWLRALISGATNRALPPNGRSE